MPVKIRYQIISGTTLALSVDPDNRTPGSQLILARPNKGDTNQRWIWIFYPLTQASILLNPATSLFAAPAEIRRGAAIVLWRLPDPLTFNRANTWQVVSGGGYDAGRPPIDTDLNMNALGSKWPPGTKVGLWTWDHGGQPNEIWASKMMPV